MGRIICIASRKGGVGKTTTAVNLSTALAMAEKRTLLADCDPQGHASSGMGIDRAKVERQGRNPMKQETMIPECILDSRLGFLKILPACQVFQGPPGWGAPPGPGSLREGLFRDLKRHYDYIIMDSPPAIDPSVMTFMAVADSLLLPLQCEFYALEGMGDFIESIRMIKRDLNPDITIEGILLTMFGPREDLSRKIAESARIHFRDKVFETVIPRTLELRESAGYGTPLLLRNIASIGAKSYLRLAWEIMDRVSPNPDGTPGPEGDLDLRDNGSDIPSLDPSSITPAGFQGEIPSLKGE